MKLNFITALLWLALVASAVSANSHDYITAYCVTYLDDSTYTIYQVQRSKDYKKVHQQAQNKQTETFINLPRNLGSESDNGSSFHLKNAKEILPKFYGQTFRESFSATQCNGIKSKRTETEFDVLLIGACVKAVPVANYCLKEGKQPALYRTDIFENIPESIIFESDTASPYLLTKKYNSWPIDFYCSGNARLRNYTHWDFGESGKFKLFDFVEEDSCHGQSDWYTYAEANLPEYIDLSSDTSFKVGTDQLKNFYNKNISIAWDLSMECGFKKEFRRMEYEILLTGKCPTQYKVSKKSEDDSPGRLNRIKVHGKSYDVHFGDYTKKCVLRKDLK